MTHNLARVAGLEPATHSLEGCCSIQLNYTRKNGAVCENRTRLTSLEGWDTTNMPTPRTIHQTMKPNGPKNNIVKINTSHSASVICILINGATGRTRTDKANADEF